jgi:hypothetical protein
MWWERAIQRVRGPPSSPSCFALRGDRLGGSHPSFCMHSVRVSDPLIAGMLLRAIAWAAHHPAETLVNGTAPARGRGRGRRGQGGEDAPPAPGRGRGGQF